MKTRKKTFLKFLCVCLCLCLLGVGVLFIMNAVVKGTVKDRIIQSADAAALEDVDCILVLGCWVKDNGQPSSMLHDRLTRGVELYDLGGHTYIADTPGFASLDVAMTCTILKENLQYDFIDFEPYIGRCRFNDCAHLKEPGCAVREALEEGHISKSRYRSYTRLYELSAQHKFWETKDN